MISLRRNYVNRHLLFRGTMPITSSSCDVESRLKTGSSSTAASIYAACNPSRRGCKYLQNLGRRDGVAVIEVALCLPVLLLVTLLFIEFTNLIFLRQSLKVASYEGIRVAIKQGAEYEDVTQVCALILDSRKVQDYEISIEPIDFTDLPRGTLTTVNIEVQAAKNQLFNLLMSPDDIVAVQSFGLKE